MDNLVQNMSEISKAEIKKTKRVKTEKQKEAWAKCLDARQKKINQKKKDIETRVVTNNMDDELIEKLYHERIASKRAEMTSPKKIKTCINPVNKSRRKPKKKCL